MVTRCGNRSAAQLRQRKLQDLKNAATAAKPLISTQFVSYPPEDQDTRTVIHIWGERRLLHDEAMLDPEIASMTAVTLGVHSADALALFNGFQNSPENTCGDSALQGNMNTMTSSVDDYEGMDCPGSDSITALNTTKNSAHRESVVPNLNCTSPKTAPMSCPLIISSLAHVKIINVVCGETHLLLQSNSGAVYSFGVGRSGALGLGENQLFVLNPVRIPTLKHRYIAQIAAGAEHSLMYSDKGEVFVCGAAEAVGDACGVARYLPTLLPASFFRDAVTHIAAGYNQSMVVTAKNQLFVWGESFFSLYYAIPHCFQQFPQEETGDNVVQIAIGRQFALALTASGRVYSWGDKTYGELGRTKPRNRNCENSNGTMRALEAAELVLTDSFGNQLPKITQVATGARHSLLLGEDGRIFAFGDNLCGQCGVGTQLTRFDNPKMVKIQAGDQRFLSCTVAAGFTHSGAITTNNLLALWGHSSHNKLIHTAPTENLLEERVGFNTKPMGVAVKSGLKDCCPKPRIIYSLLDKKATCLCLGENFSVVVTGDGGRIPCQENEHEPKNNEPSVTDHAPADDMSCAPKLSINSAV